MPQEILRQVNFTSGQLDPSLKGRRDFKSYYTGLLTATNCTFAAQGPIGRRPGFALRDMIRGPLSPVAVAYAEATFPNGVSGAASLDPTLGGTVTIPAGMGAPTPEAPFVVMTIDLGAVQAISAVDLVDYSAGAGTGAPNVGPTFPYDPSQQLPDGYARAYLLADGIEYVE